MRDHEHENSKLCPHCGGPAVFLHMLKEVRHESGWRHMCKSCGDLGYLPDPPRTDRERLLEGLTEMKRQLAWIAENGNRWPLDSETRKVVRISELRDPPPEDWKRGQSDAFNALWPAFRAIEQSAIGLGLVPGPIELDPQEEDALPF